MKIKKKYLEINNNHFKIFPSLPKPVKSTRLQISLQLGTTHKIALFRQPLVAIRMGEGGGGAFSYQCKIASKTAILILWTMTTTTPGL